MDKVLVIARYFPPLSDGGVFRVHAFVKYLSKMNWQPYVLTVKEDYIHQSRRDYTLSKAYPEQVEVIRTSSLEPKEVSIQGLRESITGTKRTSAIFERIIKPILRTIFHTIIIPDETILWAFHVLKTGLQVIEKHNIDAIFVTTPPHSVAIIGAILSKISNIPMILDVRDDWVGNPHYFDTYPRFYRLMSRFLEQFVIQTSSYVIAVTPESIALFLQKYPHQPSTKFKLIRNGYDEEETFAAQAITPARIDQRLRIVYAGVLPAKRNPLNFFKVLADINKNLFREQKLENLLQVDFFGSVRQDFVDLANQMGLQEIVNFKGQVSRFESIQHILDADVGFLIIPEEEGSQTAIPGKLYEYMGARKFILALCPQNSASDCLIRELDLGISVSINDQQAIKKAVLDLLKKHTIGELSNPLPQSEILKYERSAQTKQLASILDAAKKK